MARIKGNSSRNTLKGTQRHDSLYGFGGSDRLTGEKGNDLLDGGKGQDILLGGLGNDTYIVDHRGDRAIELANQGLDTVQTFVTYRLGNHIERLVLKGRQAIQGAGNGLNNYLVGNTGNNLLRGLGGKDRLMGGAGNDILDGGTGEDVLIGGVGNDTYLVDIAVAILIRTFWWRGSAAPPKCPCPNLADYSYNPKDRVVEAANQGIDTVRSSISYTLRSHTENLILTGTQNLDGTGNSLANSITGNSGHNVLNGGAGADILIGKTGDDTYLVDDIADVTIELANGGIDRVRTALANYTLADHIEYLEFTGTQNSNGTGNDLSNTIIGNAGDNILDGAAGVDKLIGGLGNDTYLVNDAGDLVVEGVAEGIDLVKSSLADYTLTEQVENLLLVGNAIKGTGNDLANTITGNAANNILFGGDGNDALFGGGGDDKLIGGVGIDTLTGGAGVDTFVLLETGRDIITDFDPSKDIIALNQTAFGLLDQVVGSVLNANRLVVVNSDAVALGGALDLLPSPLTRLIYSTESGNLFYDANGTSLPGIVNGLGEGGGLIATFEKVLGAAPTLTSANFVVDSIV